MFKKRKSIQVPEISPQSQLFNNAIAKLCPPSCLHVHWQSLNSLLEEDSINTKIFKELDVPFTISELNLAIENVKLNSSPGLDQVDYFVIASLPSEYVSYKEMLLRRNRQRGSRTRRRTATPSHGQPIV